jgi:hypothetical protein
MQEAIVTKDILNLEEAHKLGYSKYEIKHLEALTEPDGSNRHFLKDAVRFVGDSMEIRYDRVELGKAFAKDSRPRHPVTKSKVKNSE